MRLGRGADMRQALRSCGGIAIVISLTSGPSVADLIRTDGLGPHSQVLARCRTQSE